MGPCLDGTWGAIRNPADAIHVRELGDDSAGDGSIAAPFATIERAQDEARGNSPDKRAIAVGPGSFPTEVLFDDTDDDGIVVKGCGRTETFLLAGSPSDPILDMAIDGNIGVIGLTMDGGTNALTIREGATGWARFVDVDNSVESGIVVSGADTLGVLTQVTVETPVVGQGCGWGVFVDEASLLMSASTVIGATEVGVIVDQGDAWLENVFIQDTVPNAQAEMGRGIQAQDSWVVVSNSAFLGNADASIFMLNPDGGVISSIVIDHTDAGILGGGINTGDGLVVMGQTGGASPVIVRDSHLLDSSRAAMVLEDADVYLIGNVASGTGLFPTHGAHAFRQGGGAQITGPQAGMVLDVTAAPLDIDRNHLSCP